MRARSSVRECSPRWSASRRSPSARSERGQPPSVSASSGPRPARWPATICGCPWTSRREHAHLVATGASIGQGGASRMAIDVHIGAGGRLDADPGALIVTAGACVHLALSLALEPTATLTWREVVVLGRTGESAGRAILRWDVRRGDTPLLRQRIDLADPGLADWPGMTAGCRVLLSELRIGPDVDARTVVHNGTAVTQRLAQGATLTTVLAPSAAAAHQVLQRAEQVSAR